MVRRLHSQKGDSTKGSRRLRIFTTASAALMVAGILCFSRCDRDQPTSTAQSSIQRVEENVHFDREEAQRPTKRSEPERPLLQKLSRDIPEEQEISCEKISQPADYSVDGYSDYFDPVSSSGLQDPGNGLPESHSPDLRLIELMEESDVEGILRSLEHLANSGIMVRKEDGYSPLMVRYLREMRANYHESYDPDCISALGEATLAMARGMMRLVDEIIEGNVDAGVVLERLPESMRDMMLTHMQSRIFATEDFTSEDAISILESLDQDTREALLNADISSLDPGASNLLLSNVSDTIMQSEGDVRRLLTRLHARTMRDAIIRELEQLDSVMSPAQLEAIILNLERVLDE